MKILTQSVGSLGLVGGETIDILSEGKPVNAETLELIHRRKTASLIAVSLCATSFTARAEGGFRPPLCPTRKLDTRLPREPHSSVCYRI